MDGNGNDNNDPPEVDGQQLFPDESIQAASILQEIEQLEERFLAQQRELLMNFEAQKRQLWTDYHQTIASQTHSSSVAGADNNSPILDGNNIAATSQPNLQQLPNPNLRLPQPEATAQVADTTVTIRRMTNPNISVEADQLLEQRLETQQQQQPQKQPQLDAPCQATIRNGDKTMAVDPSSDTSSTESQRHSTDFKQPPDLSSLLTSNSGPMNTINEEWASKGIGTSNVGRDSRSVTVATSKGKSKQAEAMTEKSVTVETLVLPLFASTEADESAPHMIDIVQRKDRGNNNGCDMVTDPKTGWWFGSEYESAGNGFLAFQNLINQAVSEQGFQVKVYKDTAHTLRSGEIPFKVKCHRYWTEQCKFRFTVHWCPDQRRFKFRKLNCRFHHWTHTCQIDRPRQYRLDLTEHEMHVLEGVHNQYNQNVSMIVPARNDDEEIKPSVFSINMSDKDLWLELLRTLGREQDKQFLQEAEAGGNQYYKTFSNDRAAAEKEGTEFPTDPTISFSQMERALQHVRTNNVAVSSPIVYCKFDKELFDIQMGLKIDLAANVKHVGRGGRKGKESGQHYQKDGEGTWPISDHEHHNNQIYSGLSATSTSVVTGSGKRQKIRKYNPKKDTMATLVDKKPGWLLKNCSNIDPGDEQSGYTLHPIFQYFEDKNFPGIRAGSYHKAVGDQVNGTKPELSCYRGHCDVCYFDYVVFAVVQHWTWVFIAVPKGHPKVPAHSNEDFDEWRHGRKEIHGCRINEADQEKIDKYYTKFEQEAPGAMNNKYPDETVDDVDVYVFLLEPGGFLAFSAHKQYHSTVTSHQTPVSYRELLALHGFEWHRPTG